MGFIIQANLNRSRAVQDVLLKIFDDRGISIAVISEPNNVPEDSRWHGSADSSSTVAITWQGASHPQKCQKLDSGKGYVIVRWEEIILIGCYFSPNKPSREYDNFLSDLGFAYRKYKKEPILILGDFNARSHAWDTVQNFRGIMTQEWEAEIGFILLNLKNAATTYHPRGSSTIDLSWANQKAFRKVIGWRVEYRVDSLSLTTSIYS